MRQQFDAATSNSKEWDKQGESVANTTLVHVKGWKTRTIQRLTKHMTEELNLKNNEELSQKPLDVDASSEDQKSPNAVAFKGGNSLWQVI